MDLPPFLIGQAAYDAGKPLEANPYPRAEATGDDYPGDYRNWRAGWINAKATAEHDARLMEGK